MDLIKAYDRIDWTYLRFIFIQVGLDVEITNWIMACITSTIFSILINGYPASFFSGTIGIRQSFPHSTYLFILAIEGLSLLIKDAKYQSKIKGIKVTSNIFISHLLFEDYVLIRGEGRIQEWNYFQEIMSFFVKHHV